ncbi:SpoIIE family protein phosphatase [Nonomuraea sp. NBC_00507]|uniref:PP2C family protein-serine/threonine phosphatase n=1 Tax=Nonomuraea sp. NBC_00507 TaxID=2976002 RepID=UPI002E19314C
MNKIKVLALNDQRELPTDLADSLRRLELNVETRSPGEILGASNVPAADVLLAACDVPPNIVRAVGRRLSEGGHYPVVLAYTVDNFGALERHIRVGVDYLVPPFLPALVQARMRSCAERAEINRTIRETAEQADLLRYERELEIGREIQLGFLPDSLPKPDGWRLSVRYRPARTVAGDFYDAFELVNRRRLALIVADVCDKGVGAALFMALIRSLLRHSAEQAGMPGVVGIDRLADDLRGAPLIGEAPLLNAVMGTNDYLTRNHLRQGYFATLFFGVLDPVTGNVVYVNGGHNPPVLLRADGGDPVVLDPTGPAVGVVRDSPFALGYAQLNPGDQLFIYTDGVTEARAESGEFFGEDRMFDVLASGDVEILQRMDEELGAFVGEAEQSDDITMMAVYRMP